MLECCFNIHPQYFQTFFGYIITMEHNNDNFTNYAVNQSNYPWKVLQWQPIQHIICHSIDNRHNFCRNWIAPEKVQYEKKLILLKERTYNFLVPSVLSKNVYMQCKYNGKRCRFFFATRPVVEAASEFLLYYLNSIVLFHFLHKGSLM